MFEGRDLRRIAVITAPGGRVEFRFVACGIAVENWTDLEFHEIVCQQCAPS